MSFSQINEHIEVIIKLEKYLMPDITKFFEIAYETLQNNKTIFFCGNGGSAADCQHIAAELVGKFQKERRGLPAIALTTDTSIITSVGNDYGFESLYSRQVEALVRAGDALVGISTSGNSLNVVKAIELAKEKGAFTIGLTGQNACKLEQAADLCLKVPSNVTARVQEVHILIGHIICDMLEKAMFDV